MRAADIARAAHGRRLAHNSEVPSSPEVARAVIIRVRVGPRRPVHPSVSRHSLQSAGLLRPDKANLSSARGARHLLLARASNRRDVCSRSQSLTEGAIVLPGGCRTHTECGRHRRFAVQRGGDRRHLSHSRRHAREHGECHRPCGGGPTAERRRRSDRIARRISGGRAGSCRHTPTNASQQYNKPTPSAVRPSAPSRQHSNQ
eukprot:1185210-Prorocentrum_minimum.AAC.5